MSMRMPVLVVVLGAVCGSAQALEWTWGDTNIRLNNRLSVGAAFRMQDRSTDLIGKLNVPGQQNLCAEDNCLSLTGDPAPNQRLVDAPGAFSGINADDGNLNYDKYDVVAATSKLTTDLVVDWQEKLLVRIRAIGFYDPVNVGFNETHNDTRFQPARTERPSKVERVFANGVNLQDAYVQYAFEWGGERSATISVGNQTVRWGESTLVALNSLSEINPPNANIFRMPGAEINELFQPVPVLLFSTDLFPNISAEFLYQYGWKEVEPDPRGAFFSDSDLIGGDFAIITLGLANEDPDRLSRPAPILGSLSSTTFTTYLLPEDRPEHGGQYGMRLNYFAEWLNGGTELGFYFLNYHSRLPYAVVYATDESCARDAGDVVEAFIACEGFNGTLPRPPGMGLEPLPIDTLGAQLQYPEDIQMYGISFNTNLGEWSLAGEYSFRPNLPLQLHLTDVIFAGLQPALPANDIVSDPTGLAQIVDLVADGLGLNAAQLASQFPGVVGDILELSFSTFPGADVAVPSFTSRYRNLGRINAGQRIEGYERMQVGQMDFTAIRAFSETPFGADQIILIAEAAFTHVLDMPDLSELQFEGGGPNRTHFSPGADGTGSGGVADTRRLNPTQQTSGFADDFAWGVRSIVRAEYNNVVFGWNFKPTLIAAWDVKGIAPFPLQNFVEGRKEFVAGTDINIGAAFTARVLYQWFTGGGRDNTRKDRDNLALSLSYSF